MPVNLANAAYIAYTGMALVFITLAIFLVVLLVLQKLFPVQQVTTAVESNVNISPVGILSERMSKGESMNLSSEESSVLGGESSEISTTGQQIAAMSVALYMAMEKEQATANLHQENVSDSQLHGHSGWSIQGRTSLWNSQGRRPPPYDNKPHSAYSQEDLS